MNYQQVLSFWFEETEQINWWRKCDHFDQLITQRFGDVHRRATQCELYEWRSNAEGRLAEIIVLDQFSRNIYRDDRRAFDNDSLALALSQEAISQGFDQQLPTLQRKFMYTSYMHSESKFIHQQALSLYKALGDESTLNFEWKHKVIIDRFGRYPHRNEMLARQSTPEELSFLQQSDSSF